MFKRTTAINKILKLRKKIKVLQGGQSAGKTFGILPVLIDKAGKVPGLRIDVVSCTYGHLELGAISDFKNIMMSTNNWSNNNWHDTKHKYTFDNGSFIRFIAIDKPGKARGPRRDILYVNECNLIPFETYLNLAERTNNDIYLDFNPTHEFWVHTEVLKDIDSEFIILTFKDNEALHPNIVKNMLKMQEKAKTSTYWANRWKVYGLGLVGRLEGVIFDTIEKIKDIPKDAKLIGYGLDFGYSNDPSTLIAVYEWGDKIILHELLYRKGMTPTDLAKEFNILNIDKSKMIYADSSQPASIEEIKRYGFKIKGADKGPGSINYGISLLMDKELLITETSENLIIEFSLYSWAKDSEGKSLNVPEDKNNHGIDASRYLFVMELNNKQVNRPF